LWHLSTKTKQLSIMQLNQLVEALDAKVLSGDIIGAFDQYAADNVITHSNADDITRSKAEKMQGLQWFLGNVASVNSIERQGVAIKGDNESHSQFTFNFTNHQGEALVYNEVIRRVWNNGLIIEEQYLLNETLAPAAKATKAKKAEAAADAVVAPAADTKKAPAAKKTKAPAADDLTLVEGIGPKIADLLIAAGIVTFADLAATKPAAIKTILEAAGKRYQMHDPATWPKQAELARDGKTAELAKMQAELKGGK
jgi:predicted flap endonuclease-1-like 5' DNA nuclease